MENYKYIWLSHVPSENIPSYGGGKGVSIKPVTSIKNSDTANKLFLSFANNLGTHVDVPKHFFENGPSITDYNANFWIFQTPQLIDVPCEDGQLIDVPCDSVRLIDLNSFLDDINNDIELLLIRTGYEKLEIKTNTGMIIWD